MAVVAHEEVRASLASYAAGALAAGEAATVRAHLAAGCTSCLGDLFRQPVGQRGAAARSIAGAYSRPGRAILAMLAATVVVAMAAGLVAREREFRRAEAGRLAEALASMEAGRRLEAALGQRLLAVKGALRARRRAAETERQAWDRIAVDAGRELQVLREDLAAARHRAAALAVEVEAARAGMDVIGGQGLEMRTLKPAPPFRGVSGHALWRPADGRMLVHAFGLPAVPPEVTYVARVTLADGRVLAARLRTTASGGAVAHLVLPQDAAGVGAVEVRRASDSRRFLVADGGVR